MKLIRLSSEKFVFEMAKRERELWLGVLQRYPCVPPAHHRLSNTTTLEESTQQLLNEALAEQRTENRRRIEAFVNDLERWTRIDSGWRIELSSFELEWLLQVLNDIRIGSWVALGSPEGSLGTTITLETATHLWNMEMAGAFETAFLEALDQGA